MKMTDLLDEKISQNGIEIEAFNVINFDFSEEFNKAIENKQIAQQQALKAEQDLNRIKIEAEQKIVQAKAEADALKLQKQEIILKGKTAKEEFQNLVFVTKNNQPTQRFLINQCMQLVIQNMNKAGIDFSPFMKSNLFIDCIYRPLYAKAKSRRLCQFYLHLSPFAPSSAFYLQSFTIADTTSSIVISELSTKIASSAFFNAQTQSE